MTDTPLDLAHQQHDRHWRQFAYCYPVVSRRSGGLSIGINLNPDKACNFDCAYCQVDRTEPAPVTSVDLSVLETELAQLLDGVTDGSIFREPPLDSIEPSRRQLRDIAFSGDGEPTAYPHFDKAVQIAIDARRSHKLDDAKLILLTNACYLEKPGVRAALSKLDENNGEIWAKLDAGTQAHYETVNRPNIPLDRVVHNIRDAARIRPIVIQSLWMRLHGQPPPEAELCEFAKRLDDILSTGGRIEHLQMYTVARRPADPRVSALSSDELDRAAATVRQRVNLPMEVYYGTAS